MNIPGVDPQEIMDYAYKLNLDVNFVNNRALRTQDYETGRRLMQEVTERTIDHAFGYWYLSICNSHLGRDVEAETAKNKATHLFATNKKWNNYARGFNLL